MIKVDFLIVNKLVIVSLPRNIYCEEVHLKPFRSKAFLNCQYLCSAEVIFLDDDGTSPLQTSNQS
jgi:hypothetical protein